MSQEREPVRWIEPESDCDPLLRGLLERTRNELGDAGLPLRVERAVRERVAADGGNEQSVSGRLWRTWGPWVGLAALLLGLGFERGALAPTASSVNSGAAATGRNAADAVPAPATPSRGAAHSSATTEAVPTPADAKPLGTKPLAVGHATDAGERRHRVALTPSDTAAAKVRSAVRAGAQRDAMTTPVSDSTPVDPGVAKPGVPIQRDTPPELQLLSEAQQALRASPARALALALRHAAAYPQGRFAEEREEIAISALLATGDRAGAKARARAFVNRYPMALSAARMRDLLEGAN